MAASSHFQLTPRDPTNLSLTSAELHEIMQMLNYFNVAAMIEVLLYGIHVTLFFVCLRILYRDRKSKNFLIPTSIIIMFALATADVGISFHILLHYLPLMLELSRPQFIVALFPKIAIFVANNFIADVLLLYRCYIVWGRRRIILYLSIFLLLTDTVFGLIGLTVKSSVFWFLARTSSNPVYTWIIVAINITITAATAGRIYWVARSIQPIVGRKHVRVYKIAMAILIESGLVYSTSVLFFAVFSNGPRVLLTGAICFRLVAIMPTLMIVQVHLGRTVDIDGRHISTGINMQCSGSQRPTVILDTITSNMHFRESTIVDVTLPRSSVPGILEPGESDDAKPENTV